MTEMIDRIAEVLSSGIGKDESSEHIARKILSAMRKPTETMLVVGGKQLDCPRELYCWQAMIDDAMGA